MQELNDALKRDMRTLSRSTSDTPTRDVIDLKLQIRSLMEENRELQLQVGWALIRWW